MSERRVLFDFARSTFGKFVSTVTSIGSQRRKLMLRDMEVAMDRMMLKFPTSFGEALTQVFGARHHVASPDLQNLSDRCLSDIGLTRCRTNFDAVKPAWLT